MSMFKRFFNRKPSNQLVEISERIYVFDCCLSTEVLEEDEYNIYVGGIVADLEEKYPGSSFMVLNFGQEGKISQLSNILSQYGISVMEYARQYEGCPMLPLKVIHHVLRSGEHWLSVAENVLLMHCERGGWPVLAFMLAALVLFRKQDRGVQKILETVYKQAPRDLLHLLTPLNPQPSQLRYLHYISGLNLVSDWSSPDTLLTPLALDCITLSFLPIFGRRGCRPVIRIYGQELFSSTANRRSNLYFSSAKTEKEARYYQSEECELVKINIHQRVQGDVVLECIHLDHAREEMMFKVMFHTTFVQNNVLMLGRDEVNVMWDSWGQIPKNFKAELLFSDAGALPSMIDTVGGFEDGNETVKQPQVMSRPIEWQHLQISFKEIEIATENFQDCIGKGGYGRVYKGKLTQSGKSIPVAVKRLNEQFGQGLKEFLTEVHLLSGLKHQNLISLLGYCEDRKEKILVYEYAQRGSLDQYLRRGNTTYTLSWLERLKICVDAARGLDHLHNHVGKHQTIIHRDIKSANILLDDNWVAKISDFGLSKLTLAGLNQSAVISHACGTPGYCEPEYIITGIVKKESDVYSFGMVLFEVLCGRLCSVKDNDGFLLSCPVAKKYYENNNLDEIVDPSLREQLSSYSMNEFLQLHMDACIRIEANDLPWTSS